VDLRGQDIQDFARKSLLFGPQGFRRADISRAVDAPRWFLCSTREAQSDSPHGFEALSHAILGGMQSLEMIHPTAHPRVYF